MAFFIITPLVFLLLLYVAWPLVEETAQPVEISPMGKNSILALQDRKERDLQALKELDFDVQTGKISPQEFETMRENLKSAALASLKAFDEALAVRR